MTPIDRDSLGRMVREVWVSWAKEQPNPKPSWLLPYDQLLEPDKEVDRRTAKPLSTAGRPNPSTPNPNRFGADEKRQPPRHEKWQIGPDGRIRHRHCDNPEHYHPRPMKP